MFGNSKSPKLDMNEATNRRNGDDDDDDDDVVIVVNREKFFANRRVLANHSPYFEAMFFRSKMSESTAKEINLKGVKSSVFKMIVDFVLTGKLPLTTANVQHVLECACMLYFQKIVDACSEFMVENLTLGSCIDMWRLAKLFNLDGINGVLSHSKYMAVTNVVDVMNTQAMPFDVVKSYLSEKHVACEEHLVYDCIVDWIKGQRDFAESFDDPHSDLRRKSRELLNECVDWSKISPRHLPGVVSSDFMRYFPDLLRELNSSTVVADKLCFACRANLGLEKISWDCSSESDGAKCPPLNEKGAYLELARKSFRSTSDVPAFVTRTNVENESEADYFISCYKDNKLIEVAAVPSDTIKLCDLIGYEVCSVGRFVFIIGGEIGRIGTGRWNRNIYRLDTFSKRWEVVTQIPQNRRSCLACVVKNHIYLIGGYGQHRVRLHSMDRLDVTNMQWTHWNDIGSSKFPSFNMHYAPLDVKMAVPVGHVLYMIEFVTSGTIVHGFDTVTEEWKGRVQGPKLTSCVFEYGAKLLFVCFKVITLLDPVDNLKYNLKWDAVEMTSCSLAQLCGHDLYRFRMDKDRCIVNVEDIAKGTSVEYYVEDPGNLRLVLGFKIAYHV